MRTSLALAYSFALCRRHGEPLDADHGRLGDCALPNLEISDSVVWHGPLRVLDEMVDAEGDRIFIRYTQRSKRSAVIQVQATSTRGEQTACTVAAPGALIDLMGIE